MSQAAYSEHEHPSSLSPDYEAIPIEDFNTPLMGQEEQIIKHEGRKGDAIAKIVALSSSVVVFIVSSVAVLTHKPIEHGWFAFHPILQSLALCLFTYGVLTLQPTSQPQTKITGLNRHQLAIGAIGFPSMLLGTAVILWNKRIHESAHFTTWHGTFGIITVAWMVIQVLLGGASVWFNGRVFGGGAKAKAVWKYHRLSGYAVFPLLLLTTHLGGAWSHWMTRNSAYAAQVMAYTLAPLLILVSIYSRVRPSKMKFF